MKSIKAGWFFRCTVLMGLLLFCLVPVWAAQEKLTGVQEFKLENGKILYTMTVENGAIKAEELKRPSKSGVDHGFSALRGAGGFALELMWTDWRAPGKANNADNLASLTDKDFILDRAEKGGTAGETEEWRLFFKGKDWISLELCLKVRLEPGAFFVKRQLLVSDPAGCRHFLVKSWPLKAVLSGWVHGIKDGGFGQPVAVRFGNGGAFFGLERPDADNRLVREGTDRAMVQCGQDMGEIVTKEWLAGDWVVEALTPDTDVKKWFFSYLDSMRVMPLRPYVLYNSWYDLRSPDYAKTRESVMNAGNIRRIIDLLRTNLVEKYGVGLDAFVLDDGWDVYESDWVLRAGEFPGGLKPIADELKNMGTDLGIWLGPTGGYSFRMKRLDWMKGHGYETVGQGKNQAMLCLAGKNYHDLLKKRVSDMVANDGVAYFKWDGIQFSCSEPDHGHPVGIFSRRAVIDALIDLCRAVREKNPKTFLNITSGTWLSPWWVKYANQIWMDGSDYGFADVPTLARRHASITYRDIVLYEDFNIKGLWFPIANLMTHGIIKGGVETVGSEEDPLPELTDDVLFYFARGVSMYELYISPGLLKEAEWQTIARSIHWAKERFPILAQTEMIGGNPAKGETYGYVHFKGNRGILAVRNPVIEPAMLAVKLDPAFGLCPHAASLVVERVYPNRLVLPDLYAAGASLDIALAGYETAVYEVYPLSDAGIPLLTNVVFDLVRNEECRLTYHLYKSRGQVQLLNPGKMQEIFWQDRPVTLDKLDIPEQESPEAVGPVASRVLTGQQSGLEATFTLADWATQGELAFLLRLEGNAVDQKLPEAEFILDKKKVKARVEMQEGNWAWYVVPVQPGQHTGRLAFSTGKKAGSGTVRVSAWLLYNQAEKAREISFRVPGLVKEWPLPPLPRPAGLFSHKVKLAEAQVNR